MCFASLTADRNIVAYIEANKVYAHLITIRTKTVTNTVIVLKDTITKYKTKKIVQKITQTFRQLI